MEKTLKKIITWGIYLTLFTPFIISTSTYFPYIVGKTIAFRVIIELLFPIWIAWSLLARHSQTRNRSETGHETDAKRFRFSFASSFASVSRWVRERPLAAALLVYLAVFVLATIFSVYPYRSFWSNAERMDGLFTQLHYLAFFLILITVFKNDAASWRRLFFVSILASVLVSLTAYLQWLKVPWFLSASGSGARPEGSLGNPSYLAVYLLFHVGFALLLWLEEQRPGWRVFYSLVIVNNLFLIWLAATRGVYAGILGAFILIGLAMLLLRPFRGTALRKAAVVFLVFIGLTMLGSWLLKDSSLVRKSYYLDRAASIFRLGQDTTFHSRLINWKLSLRAWEEHPVLGWGPEASHYAFYKYFDPRLFSIEEAIFDRPHNKLLEVLELTGIVGLLAYLAIFAALGRELWKRLKISSLPPLIVGWVVAAYFLQNIFIFDQFGSYLPLFFLLGFVQATAGSIDSFNVRQNSGRQNPTAVMPPFAIVLPVVFLAIILALYLIALNLRHFRAAQLITASFRVDTLAGVAEISKQTYAKRSPFDFEMGIRFETIFQRLSKRSSDEDMSKALDFAIEHLSADVQKEPYDLRGHLRLANYYIGKYEAVKDGEYLNKAEEVLKNARKLAPNLLNIFYQLASVEIARGDYDTAFDYIQEAINKSPQAPRARWLLAQLYAIQKDYNRAVEEFELAFKYGYGQYWGDLASLKQLAQIYAQAGKYERVAAFYERAIDVRLQNAKGLTQDDLQLFASLARTYAELKQYDKSRSTLDRLRKTMDLLKIPQEEMAIYEREIENFLSTLPEK